VRAGGWSEAAVALICLGGGAALIATRRPGFGVGLLLGWAAALVGGGGLWLLNASATA
jgi:hypothetical protein